MLVLGILQTAVWPHFTIARLSPQLPLLVALTWGLLRGINEGIVWAFIAGLWMDIFSMTPLGVTAVSYMGAVTAVLWIKEAFPANRLLTPLLTAAGATLLSLLFSLLLLRLLNLVSLLQAGSLVWPLIPLNTLAMLPVYWSIYALDRILHPPRLQP